MRVHVHQGLSSQGFISMMVYQFFLFIRMMVGERRLMRMIAYN